MAKREGATVSQYLAGLPAARRKEIEAVRAVVKKHMPTGYEEGIQSGMISWQVPLERYPSTYNKQPLSYVALAAQKNYNALYLVGCYMEDAQREQLAAAFKSAGLQMDMGKSCLRFSSPQELPLDAIGKVIGSMPPEAMIEAYEKARPKKR